MADLCASRLVMIWYLVGSIVLLLLAVRFFWGVGNIRRDVRSKLVKNLCQRAAEGQDVTDDAEISALKQQNWFRMMILDVPVLFSHSFLFYLLCVNFGSTVEQAIENSSQSFHVQCFTLIYSFLLLFNAMWLLSLRGEGNQMRAEYAWMINNFSFGIFGVLIWFILFEAWIPTFLGYLFVLVVFATNSVRDYWLTGWAYSIGEPG
jgi:hypothetical protein